MTFSEFWNYALFSTGSSTLTVGMLITLFLAITVIRIFLWVVTTFFLKQYFQRKSIDLGRSYAITTFIKYIIYVFGAIWCLEILGISFSVLWGGAAALLVGVGLGLQQTFNDLTSGIILLSEGTVEVGDVVIVDGMMGTVQEIGLRTSKVETRNAISILIPNSKLVMENAINYSHNPNPVRFQLNVGVAYGSDVHLVTALIMQAMKETEGVSTSPSYEVQFQDFGNSSLDFVAHFYTSQFLRIDFIRSKMRYKINDLFKENKVEIPFPQQDLWIRNPEALRPIL